MNRHSPTSVYMYYMSFPLTRTVAKIKKIENVVFPGGGGWGYTRGLFVHLLHEA